MVGVKRLLLRPPLTPPAHQPFPARVFPSQQGGEPEEEGETEAEAELVQLTEAAREALGARHVICLHQPSEQASRLATAIQCMPVYC